MVGISSHCELMRVNPSAYDYFFIFMRVNNRTGNPGAVRIHGRANGLGPGASARGSKVKFDSIPVNPTKSDLIRLQIFVFMERSARAGRPCYYEGPLSCTRVMLDSTS